MESISVTDVQDLVLRLPESKLPDAYRLLRGLADQQDEVSLQVEFMRLSATQRRSLLTQQAAEIASHYEQTAAERQDWQGGDFQDEYQSW